jgi:hypothetical protein
MLEAKIVHFPEVLGNRKSVFGVLKVSVERYSMKGERAE